MQKYDSEVCGSGLLVSQYIKCVSHFSVNVKMDLHKVGCVGVDWIEVACGHVAGTYKRGNEPSDSIKCGEFLE